MWYCWLLNRKPKQFVQLYIYIYKFHTKCSYILAMCRTDYYLDSHILSFIKHCEIIQWGSPVVTRLKCTNGPVPQRVLPSHATQKEYNIIYFIN